MGISNAKLAKTKCPKMGILDANNGKKWSKMEPFRAEIAKNGTFLGKQIAKNGQKCYFCPFFVIIFCPETCHV